VYKTVGVAAELINGGADWQRYWLAVESD
jgi:hypothetical protein